MQSRILVADKDPVICSLLFHTLKDGGYDIDVVHRGEDALQCLSSHEAPRLALVDWAMPGMPGTEVCRSLRKTPSGLDAYVFLMGSRQREEDTLEAFDAGADEFITKPFEPKALLARVHAVERRLQSEGSRGSPGLLHLLKEASQGATGEVVVRSKSRLGRVAFHKGKVAWVHVSGGAPLLPFLKRLGIAAEDARMVMEACSKEHRPYMDTLVQWGLISRERLEEQLREELSARLALLLDSPEISNFFIPGETGFKSSFSYDLSEIEPAHTGPSSGPYTGTKISSRPVPVIHGDIIQVVASLGGVESAALIDPPSGLTTLSVGQPHNRDLVRGMIRLFKTDVGEDFQQTMLSSKNHYHVLQALSEGTMLYVRVDKEKNPNLGLLQLELREAVKNLPGFGG